MANKIQSFKIIEKLWRRIDVIAKENETTKRDVVITALEYFLERVETKNG
jgi:predicted transcriptional regulator